MKLNRLTAAIATSTALLSAAANALQPTEAPDIEIFMSGATAQDGNIEQLFTELCVSNTLDTFKDNANSSSPGARHNAYFCQLDSSKVTGLAASNPKVLLHKRGAGGSAQGVNPVLDEQKIEAMAINNGNCDKQSGEAFYRCRVSLPGDTIQQVSDAGVSDVNPEMFTGENTPDGSKAADAAKIQERMTVQSGGALVFGVPVTKTLRDALQQAQIETGVLPGGCAGQETEACMPSLSKQLVASLFAGQIGKWSDVKVVTKGGSTPAKSLFEYATGAIDEKAHICRRVNGSGTQAQANAKFLNSPCTAGALSPVKTSNNTAGPVVVLNSGSGDVDTCLDDYNDGTNNGGNNTTGLAWAIGVQSTERNADNSKNYRFVKIDGYAPTLENAYSGHYMDFAELTYQWRKSNFNGPTGDKLVIIQKIATEAGKPSIIAKNNEKFKQVYGQAGYLAVSASGFEPSANGVFNSSNPVTPYTHAPNGLSLNNCRAPVVDRTDTGAQPNRL